MQSRYQNIFANLSDNHPHRYKRVLLIDGMNMFISAWTVNPQTNDHGEHIGGSVGFLKRIASTIRDLEATYCLVVFDGKGGNTKRRKINENYKANRNVRIAINRNVVYDDPQREAENMDWQIRTLVDYLEDTPINITTVESHEADDIISWLAWNYFAQEDKCENITIVSEDKDYLQLTSNPKINVYRRNRHGEKEKYGLWDAKRTSEAFEGIHIDNLTILRAICGDTSDNLTGVKGVKEKTLLKYFPELAQQVFTLDEFFSKLEGIPKLSEKFDGYEKSIRDNYSVMDLKAPLMSNHGIYMTLESVQRNKVIKNWNPTGLARKLVRDFANDAIRNYDHWYNNFITLKHTNLD